MSDVHEGDLSKSQVINGFRATEGKRNQKFEMGQRRYNAKRSAIYRKKKSRSALSSKKR